MSNPILIVDDDQDSCETLAKYLRKCGYQVDTAYDGQSALRAMADIQYSLAIIDYRMPDMNGVDLFHNMRVFRPNVNGIFLTGFATIDIVYPAIFEGIERILQKPVDLAELLTVVDEIVGVPT